MNIRRSVIAALFTLSGAAFAEVPAPGFAPLNSGFNPPPVAKAGPGSVQMAANGLPEVAVDGQQKKAVSTVGGKGAVKGSAGSKQGAAKAPKKNPYDIPDAAIELIPEVRERFSLPRLGNTQGAAPRLMEQNVVKVGSGRNEVVYVSFRQPNRISTPFTKPRIVDMSGTEFQVINQDIYVAPSKEAPIGIFVSGDEPGSQVASLTLVPANIPGQNISLVFEAPRDIPANLIEKGAEPTNFDIVRSTLLSAINGVAPDGYEFSQLRAGASRIGNVMVTPRKVMTGRSDNVFIYDLQNLTSQEVELSEQSFYEEGTRGIMFWPHVKLAPGGKSQAFIMALKKDE